MRASRSVLREAGGEIPPAYSPARRFRSIDHFAEQRRREPGTGRTQGAVACAQSRHRFSKVLTARVGTQEESFSQSAMPSNAGGDTAALTLRRQTEPELLLLQHSAFVLSWSRMN